MIENRPLNRVEILEILNDAPAAEVKNLKRYLETTRQHAYDFLNKSAVNRFGLVIDGRPIYFAYYVPREEGGFELWTVVNSNVIHQFSLFKHSRKNLYEALKTLSPIYATMETHNQKNIDWVLRLGFKEETRADNTVTFKIEKPKE